MALFVPLVTWTLNTFFKAKARLLLASPHTFTFLVQQPLLNAQGQQVSPTQTVHTRSLLVWNAGKEAATKIEWVFNWKPLCINVWPPRHCEEHTEPDNRYVMIFDSLAPAEYLGCELFSINADLPNLLTVRRSMRGTNDHHVSPARDTELETTDSRSTRIRGTRIGRLYDNCSLAVSSA